jgi:hypothetical protein
MMNRYIRLYKTCHPEFSLFHFFHFSLYQKSRTVQSGFVPHLTFLVQKLLGEMETCGNEKTSFLISTCVHTPTVDHDDTSKSPKPGHRSCPGPRSRSTCGPQMRPPQTGVFGGVQQMRPHHRGFGQSQNFSLGKVNLPTPIPTLRPSYLNLPTPVMLPAHGRFVLKKTKHNNFQPSGGGEKKKLRCPVHNLDANSVNRATGHLSPVPC